MVGCCRTLRVPGRSLCSAQRRGSSSGTRIFVKLQRRLIFCALDTSPPLPRCLEMLLRRLSLSPYTCANTVKLNRRPVLLAFSRSHSIMADTATILDTSATSPAPHAGARPRPVSHTHPGYVGRCVLAPMVRTGELPTRLLALRYGADAVWGTVCPPPIQLQVPSY